MGGGSKWVFDLRGPSVCQVQVSGGPSGCRFQVVGGSKCVPAPSVCRFKVGRASKCVLVPSQSGVQVSVRRTTQR